ncbi:Hly III family transporter [Corynebacterium falsenii]|uniref:Hly III family transporter n=1 Tax=Corynebacterium falsenii TaxID=108486 RepID=A0A418Q8S5_9CORY|nr:hemolysin III family protein [Corynebacterium falsenii]RIX36107.1 Hly III family transporter [Corynebacterium falsenii]
MRGRLHANAAWYFGGTSTALVVAAAGLHGISPLTFATAVYAALLVCMLSVSALYHRFPWRTEGAVAGWRRADHSMIALFIAGTYGPVIIGANTDARSWIVLGVAWVAALAAVALNILWITHPRWLSVSVYLILGWTALADLGNLSRGLGPAVLVLIIIGGIIYTAGAVAYALKWPNISVRWFGFHEVFHAATILAAGFHHIAIWLIVLNNF